MKINHNTPEKHNGIQTLDCTIRDGGYVNNWKFDRIIARETYRACSKAGIDVVEIGCRASAKYFDPEKYGPWRFSTDNDIRETLHGIDGPKISVMGDFGKIEREDFDDKKNSPVDIVRIAAHKNTIHKALSFLDAIKQKGYMVSLQAMAYATYSEPEKKKLLAALKNSCLDYFYIADSYGSILPNQIEGLFEPVLSLGGGFKAGFHAHNSLQMAFANTLEAMRCGVAIVDCSFYGIGRGAGNLPSEILISYLESKNRNKYNVIPILSAIDEFFITLHKEWQWGYQLSYMLSGMFDLHPDFAKKLVEFREYSIEEIWSVLDYIKQSDPVGFSEALLKKIITEGLIGSLHSHQQLARAENDKQQKITPQPSDEQKVPYMDRYRQRDFLVLANGPTLTTYKDKIDAFVEKYNPIILGANYVGGLFKPHYHAFNNHKRFVKFVDTVDPASKLFIGQNIEKNFIREHTERNYETIYFRDIINADFDIRNGVIQSNCRTISILLLAVASVMGAKRIFSVGMDGYLGLDTKESFHFYDEREDQIMDREFFAQRHYWCQNFLEQINRYLINQGKEGVHILTPTTYKKFYKGIENYL